MEKQAYEKLKDIKIRVQKGEPTTFAERNFLNVYNKANALATGGKYRQPKKQRKNGSRN